MKLKVIFVFFRNNRNIAYLAHYLYYIFKTKTFYMLAGSINLNLGADISATLINYITRAALSLAGPFGKYLAFLETRWLNFALVRGFNEGPTGPLTFEFRR